MKEIELRKDYIGNEEVKTVYFGGGTPSLLLSDDLKLIMNALYSAFRINPDAEVTFESNPDDINPASLQTWKESGVNRLSIGIQSFFKADLEWMNRAHNEVQAKDCILMAHDAGFHNISIDLIYGTPTLPDDNWMTNMQNAISLNIPHLSCYALTVETGTALSTFIRKNQMADVNTEDQARQFLMMTDVLGGNGYEHYEISNFALPGRRSQHNSSYWSGAKYIGLGPSAHSFNGTSRQWNVANNALYIKALDDNKVPFEQETLSNSQRFNEYIMTSLRTIEGTDISKTREVFGVRATDDLIKHSEKFIECGWMQEQSNRLVLTREGKLFADGIASELFEIA